MQMISETCQLHYLRKKFCILGKVLLYKSLKVKQAYKLNYLEGIKQRQPILTTII